MKINEVILNEGVADSDWWKKQAYTKLGGLGGDTFKSAAVRSSFIDKFENDFALYSKSAQKGGRSAPLVGDYIKQYINKYRWEVNPQELKDIIVSSGNDVNKAANNMFALAQQQKQQSKGGVLNRSAQAAGNVNSFGNTGGNPAVKQVINVINKMSSKTDGPSLEQIAKAAMMKIYKLSKAEYAELRQEIITGRSTTPTQQGGSGAFGNIASNLTKQGAAQMSADHDRLATGTNESIRKTRKI